MSQMILLRGSLEFLFYKVIADCVELLGFIGFCLYHIVSCLFSLQLLLGNFVFVSFNSSGEYV